MSFLTDKRAIVTGGSKGIGLAVASSLAAEGINLLICARSNDTLQKALEHLRAKAAQTSTKISGLVADVSSAADVANLFQNADKELGGLDILINNAGVGVFRAAGELSIDEWNKVIGTNLSGVFYCTREALPRFAKARGGQIINISSLAGRNPFAGGSAYNASKFGLNGFSEAAMLDHRYDNVRISYIMPGSVATDFAGQPSRPHQDWKIAPADIAEIVLSILRMPERTLISRIEVRPSRPRKD